MRTLPSATILPLLRSQLTVSARTDCWFWRSTTLPLAITRSSSFSKRYSTLSASKAIGVSASSSGLGSPRCSVSGESCANARFGPPNASNAAATAIRLNDRQRPT
jgi:hypothetical protein